MLYHMYIYIHVYSDPKVDRIFFGGCGFFVGIMLGVVQIKKKTVVGILRCPPRKSKTGSWNMVWRGK